MESQLVDKIIAILWNRKGFDDWWDNVEEEFQQEIREALNAEIKNYFWQVYGVQLA